MTLSERIDLAKTAMAKIHAGIAQAQTGANEILALDTPENVSDLDASDVRALRREAKRLKRMLDHIRAESDAVHDAMNDIALSSPVISPQFGGGK